jgi:hypothetical protein
MGSAPIWLNPNVANQTAAPVIHYRWKVSGGESKIKPTGLVVLFNHRAMAQSNANGTAYFGSSGTMSSYSVGQALNISNTNSSGSVTGIGPGGVPTSYTVIIGSLTSWAPTLPNSTLLEFTEQVNGIWYGYVDYYDMSQQCNLHADRTSLGAYYDQAHAQFDCTVQHRIISIGTTTIAPPF